MAMGAPSDFVKGGQEWEAMTWIKVAVARSASQIEVDFLAFFFNMLHTIIARLDGVLR